MAGFLGGVAGGSTIAIVIKAYDEYSKGMEKANKALKGIEKTAKKTSLITKAAFAGVALAIGKFALSAASMASKYQAMERSFSNLAGSMSGILLHRMNIAAEGTVSNFNMIQNANKAMLLGIDAHALPRMMEIARASSKITGQDVSYMFESIALGVGRQSKLILDNLGIIVDSKTAYEKYAKEIGKTSSQLTEAERKQAYLNEAMRQGEDIIEASKGATNKYADSVARLSAEWNNLKISIGPDLALILTNLIGAGNQLIENVKENSFWERKLNEAVEEGRISRWDLSRKVTELGRDYKSTAVYFGIYGEYVDEQNEIEKEAVKVAEDNIQHTSELTAEIESLAQEYNALSQMEEIDSAAKLKNIERMIEIRDIIGQTSEAYQKLFDVMLKDPSGQAAGKAYSSKGKGVFSNFKGVKGTSVSQNIGGKTYTAVGGTPGYSFNDFISRPGQEPVPFSPDDTIIGVKNPSRGLGGGIVININGGTFSTNRFLDEVERGLQQKGIGNKISF